MAKEINVGNNHAFDYINKKIEKEKNKEKVVEPAYQEPQAKVIQEEQKPQEKPIENLPETPKEEPSIEKNKEKEEKEPTRQFAVYIPISLFNKFRVYSEIKGISQKKILVDALKEYMDKIDDNYIKEELLKKRPF